MKNWTPKDTQESAITFLNERKRAGLFVRMGFGKTAVALNWLEQQQLPAIIVAPKATIGSTWPAEIDKWQALSGLKVVNSVLDKGSWVKDHDILCVNYDRLHLVRDMARYKTAIIDESSFVKDPKTRRFRTLRNNRADAILLLSGTPIPNGYLNLWPQLELLQPGLFGTYWGYRHTYFVPEHSGKWAKLRLRYKADRVILERCQHLIMSDYGLDLDTTYSDYDVDVQKIEVPRHAHEQVYQLRKDFITSMGDQIITAQAAGAILTKTRQIINGTVYDEQGNAVAVHDAKIQALKDVYAKVKANGPLLVVVHYKHDLARLKEAIPALVLFSRDKVDCWNAGHIPIMAINPGSAAHGLNLQFGGHQIVWFSLSYSYEQWAQVNARLARPGQRNRVKVTVLAGESSVDLLMLHALRNKRSASDTFLSEIRAEALRIYKNDGIVTQ